ncbi:hypothetical protein D3C87_1971300 [compost metagenome]
MSGFCSDGQYTPLIRPSIPRISSHSPPVIGSGYNWRIWCLADGKRSSCNRSASSFGYMATPGELR